MKTIHTFKFDVRAAHSICQLSIFAETLEIALKLLRIAPGFKEWRDQAVEFLDLSETDKLCVSMGIFYRYHD